MSYGYDQAGEPVGGEDRSSTMIEPGNRSKTTRTQKQKELSGDSQQHE